MIIEVEARFNTRSKPSTKENKDGKVREMGKIYSTYYNNNKDLGKWDNRTSPVGRDVGLIICPRNVPNSYNPYYLEIYCPQ